MKENLKNKIRYARIKQGMTQAELAIKLGISPSTIGMYEQGRRIPDYDTLAKMCDILDMSVFDFFPYDKVFSVDVVLKSIIECLSDNNKPVLLNGKILDEQNRNNIVCMMRLILSSK